MLTALALAPACSCLPPGRIDTEARKHLWTLGVAVLFFGSVVGACAAAGTRDHVSENLKKAWVPLGCIAGFLLSDVISPRINMSGFLDGVTDEQPVDLELGLSTLGSTAALDSYSSVGAGVGF